VLDTNDKKTIKRRAMAQVRAIEAILRRWDPLGVLPGEAAPADEYDSYATHIVSLVNSGCSMEALAQHLSGLRVSALGAAKENARELAIAGEMIRALRPLVSVASGCNS
jgi:hypothetical protein